MQSEHVSVRLAAGQPLASAHGVRSVERQRLMKRVRLFVLLFALLVALAAYYYHNGNSVRVEVVQFNSNLIGRPLPYTVVLPRGYTLITSRRTRYPVLYLLHGWGGHYDGWLTHTGLMQYASDYQLIVVTPEGGDGWYTNSATVPSDQYESYVVQELIKDVETRYRTVQNRRGRAIAGNSMGGYGALKYGLKYPELFTFAASMSGALDAPARTDEASINQAFGPPNDTVREGNDLQRLVREFPAKRAGLLPYIYLDCGEADSWLNTNRSFVNLLLERKIPHEYRQVPGGHVWPYWDRQVREVLRLAAERMVQPEH